MEKVGKAKKFEQEFKPGTGVIPTPVPWIDHFWNAHRDRVVASIDTALASAQTVLFVGVGTGDVIPRLRTAGKRLIGVDLNKAFLEQAAAYCEAIEGDGSSLPVPDESCDLVICNMVLHHIVGQGGLETTIREASRVLRPGGAFMAFEPNLYHPSGMALSLLNLFHLYHVVGGGSDYEYALSPFALKRLCKKHFHDIAIRAVTYAHPRFPITMQDAIFRIDRSCANLYPFGFSFSIVAKK